MKFLAARHQKKVAREVHVLKSDQQ